MRARWRRELDQAISPPTEKLRAVLEMIEQTNTITPATTPIVIGSKVRRIDEPQVVLRVREIDPEGLIDGTPKALCTNAFGHGKFMALADLEVAT